MRSLASVAGSYSNVELRTCYLWIAVDHTYNRIPGLLGSHEPLCTVFSCKHNLNPWNISFVYQICLV